MTTVADLIGADGAAGQPQMLQAAGGRLGNAGTEVARLEQSLSRVESAEWRGLARARFDKLRDATVHDDLKPIVDGYGAGVSALQAYGHRLDEIQQRARSLAKTIGAEEHKLGNHRRDQFLADGLVSAAKTAAIVTTLTPAAKLAAELALKEAKGHQARMRTQTAATEQRIAHLRRQGAELSAELDQAARQCAMTLEGIRPPAGQKQLTPAEIAAGGAAAVAGAAGAIRRVTGQNGKSGSKDPGRSARETKLREMWNATPASRGASVAGWARDQVGQKRASETDAALYHDWWDSSGSGEWSGDCIKFVQMSYAHGSPDIKDPYGGVHHGNAADVYWQYQRQGAIHPGTPPEGAIVFWPYLAAPYGHVAIADGAGGVYTTVGYGGDNLAIDHYDAATCKTRFGASAGWTAPS